MSYGSQYNLNSRLTYLEYLLNNGPLPPALMPNLEEVLTEGSSGNSGQTITLSGSGADTIYNGASINSNADFIVGTTGGDVMTLYCAINALNIFRNNTVIPEGYIYTFGGTQTNFSPTEIIITDGTTTNTLNKTGYTTKNSVQNSTHYLNFSDNSATGIGPIQKTAGISCNPNLNSITATTFNGALNGNANTSTTSTYINSTQSSGVNQQSLCLFQNTPPNSNNTVQGAFNQFGVNYLTSNPQGNGNFSINGGAYIHDYPYIVFTGAEQTNWTNGSTYTQYSGSDLKFYNGANSSTLNATSLTINTVNGSLNGNANTSTNSSNSVITTAAANTNYTLLVATANTGTLPILGSGSDLNYNPVSQTLSVKNMVVSGNETQTGIITTNVLKTDIMIQQVSYLSAQVNNLANFTALLALGTFIMTTFSNSTVVNSIVTIGLPALPNDGSYDGYTFQLRKLNGGVNQTTQNWTITAPSAIIIPNGNTLNSGSGGANSSSTPASFTQRYTIVTTGGVGYYVGCNN